MKSIGKQNFAVLILLFLAGTNLFAAPHNGEIFNLIQPDGTTVAVRVYGDEYYQDVESLDGYTLIRDETTGWICYAQLSADGNSYVSTGIIYDPLTTMYPEFAGTFESTPAFQVENKHIRINKEQIELQRRANFEVLQGRTMEEEIQQNSIMFAEPAFMTAESALSPVEYITGLTIIVDFSDEIGTIPQSEIDKFCNQEGYAGYNNHGSVRDYFYDVSNGKFVFTNTVTQYIRMPYEKDTYYDVSLNNSYGRTKELVLDALTELEKTGFDFSGITVRNGEFVSVNILYAGNPNHGWAKGLWPHRGWLGGRYTAPNGIKVNGYEMTNISTELSLYTFTHENGHLIFNWPDLYSYDGHSSGIGYFGLMCGRIEKYPIAPNPYFQSLRGWIDLVDITYADSGTVFTALANDFTAYKYTASDSEYFIIQNRAKEGRSLGLRGEGLVIWHIDRNGRNTYSQYDDYVAIEQADGLNEIEERINMSDANDFFRAGHNDSFSDSTSPNGQLHSGSYSGIDIRNISSVGSSMTFSVGPGIVPPSPTPTSGPAIDPWNSSTIYTAGDQVVYEGYIWEAKWWTQGNTPVGTDWGPWKKIGPAN